MKELREQLIGALLVVLTAAALVSAGINFQQQSKFRLPDDGVTWVDRTAESREVTVEALYVAPASAGERAGLKKADVLRKINGLNIHTSTDASRVLARLGAWKSADYVLERGGVEIKAKVIVSERALDVSLYYQYFVGLAYLGLGLFVYFRRGQAPRATHFYILCLVSFVLSTFHYTGKLNNFDKVIYWGNVAAGLLAPTLFVHFCLRFPEVRPWFRGRWKAVALYLPAAALLAVFVGFASGTLRVGAPLVEVRWALDRAWLAFLSLMYLTGAATVSWEFRRTTEPVVRQQLKWLRNGAVLGVLPFTLFYVGPYLFGAIPGPYMNLAVLSLVFIPVTWAYAVLRYRLMDVDVIFQQGLAYTAATLAVIAVFYGLVLSIGPFEELPESSMVLLIVIATFIFQPMRNWIQEVLDRHYFYKDRYDYRRTLIDFARDLSRETDLGTMLPAVSDRLRKLLCIEKVAFFLAKEDAAGFRLVDAADPLAPGEDDLDLSFLSPNPEGPLFFERTRHTLDALLRHAPAGVRQAIAQLDLTYYFPCSVRGRTIAYLGVSRTTEGDFLASEDVELLTTLAGYFGIAIENAQLYRSLEHKVAEYERLKEFSENIVESINVGIVAADLEDRVESWNTQMEAMTGITRGLASGRRLADLFPPRLAATFDQIKGASGVQHIYKSALHPRPATGGNGAPGVEDVLVNIAVAPLFSREGEQIGRLIIFDDVTERAVLEQRLVQADKLSSIGLLAAGVAHEVNTPLAVISTYAQMLAKQVSGDDQKSHLLEKIAKQTFRASEIVNSLLNFSRTSKTEFEALDLHRSIRETVALLDHQLAKAAVTVHLDAAAGSAVVRANSGKMQQVFINLILNARDAMESQPEGLRQLRVRTESSDGVVRISVSDSGRGIEPEDLPRIFDPFFTTKGAKKGTGLGLSVTYGIVREHAGSIEVSSRPGFGTVFHLEFPLLHREQVAQPQTAAAVNA